jgi:hypothetical protein
MAPAPTSTRRRKVVNALVVTLVVFAVAPVLMMGVVLIGLGAMGGDQDQRDVVALIGGLCIAVVVAAAVLRSVLLSRGRQRGVARPTHPQATHNTASDHVPPPPGAPRNSATRLVGVAAATLAAVFVVPLAFLGVAMLFHTELWRGMLFGLAPMIALVAAVLAFNRYTAHRATKKRRR